LTLLAHCARPEQALTEADATTICQWLIDTELAFTAASVESKRLAQAAKDKQPGRLARFNPLYMKVPVCFPDRFFGKMLPWMGWLFSKPMVAITLLLMVLGGYQVLANWTQFVIASRGIFAPGQWMWLGLCWLLFKIVHECSHGTVCKKFGGSVHEAGLVFILFAPLAYVDVTSSWRFKSKWHRMFVAAAGMYIELLIASVAALIWAGTEPGVVNHLCFHLILMASVTTLLFNTNPLMRFDGYYLLSDGVDIPNLYTDGQLFLRYLGRKYVLGLPAEVSTGSWSRDTFIRLYGIAAFVWRSFITFFLILAAATMFEGAGLVIALFAAAIWLAVPAWKFAANLMQGSACGKPSLWRLAGVVLPAVLVIFYFLTHTPWPGVKRTPAVVEYSPLAVVRAGSPGFVAEIHVRSGQQVEAGQLLAALVNLELQSEFRDVELAIKQSQMKSRALKQREELAAYQAEQKQLESLLKKREEKRDEVAQLTVRGPISGTVIVRDPDALFGTYATTGAEIVSIGDERRKELRMSIGQEDLDAFVAYQGK
jgi:putative peptide zinc metalloprotease protein